MILSKRIIALCLILFLVLPLGLSLFHVWVEHDKEICHDLSESHVHRTPQECNHNHYFNSSLYFDAFPVFEMGEKSWAEASVRKPDSPPLILVRTTFFDRGPPHFDVF